jgi:hypothetical protein
LQSYQTSLKCKAWSYRASDGACRLFTNTPDQAPAVSLVVENSTEAQRAWYSGQGELFDELFDGG